MNLLDEQTKIYGRLSDLVGAREDNPLGNTTNYLELISKINLPEEQKEMLYEQYQTYELSLDPSQKDSLKLMVDIMMTTALEKIRND